MIAPLIRASIQRVAEAVAIAAAIHYATKLIDHRFDEEKKRKEEESHAEHSDR